MQPSAAIRANNATSKPSQIYTNPMNIIHAWRTWLYASDLSPQTVRLRTYQLTRFAEQHPDLLAVTPKQITEWLGRPEWSTETRRSQLSALHSFYGWLQACGHRPDDPSRIVRRVKARQHQPRPAPDRVVNLGMIAADARVRLMLTLAVREGLRRGEIAQVHTNDLLRDESGWLLLVHGKGRKERVIPLADDVASQLRAIRTGWAFPGQTGGHLSADYVGVLMSRALPDGWTAHTLRHAFATKAYHATRDLLAVQELLGHASPTTTRNYVLMPADSMRAAVIAAA